MPQLPMYYFNPNSGMKAFNNFNSAPLTNPAVGFQAAKRIRTVVQPNSALMSRTVLIGAKLFW